MTEDQSIVGRRRIYYDRNGGEALICSDSEEEAVEGEEEKREFSDSENYIIRLVAINYKYFQFKVFSTKYISI